MIAGLNVMVLSLKTHLQQILFFITESVEQTTRKPTELFRRKNKKITLTNLHTNVSRIRRGRYLIQLNPYILANLLYFAGSRSAVITAGRVDPFGVSFNFGEQGKAVVDGDERGVRRNFSIYLNA